MFKKLTTKSIILCGNRNEYMEKVVLFLKKYGIEQLSQRNDSLIFSTKYKRRNFDFLSGITKGVVTFNKLTDEQFEMHLFLNIRKLIIRRAIDFLCIFFIFSILLSKFFSHDSTLVNFFKLSGIIFGFLFLLLGIIILLTLPFVFLYRTYKVFNLLLLQ